MAKVSEHLAHETEFRGKDIIKNRESKLIVFCGLGALGSKVIHLLASQGYRDFVGIDDGRVKPSNYGTQEYDPRDVKRMKTVACAMHMHVKWSIGISCRGTRLRENNVKKMLQGQHGQRPDLVVEVFDNAPSRTVVLNFCAAENIACVHAGMSHDGFGEIEWNEDYHVTPTPEGVDAPCDYPLATNLVALTAGLLAETINRFIDKGVKQTLHFTLNDLHIHKVRDR